MDILINEKSLDFQLDEILTLAELLENVQNWAGKENMFILDYQVNGQKDVEDTNKYDSTNIDRLDISIGSREALVWENILELQTYIHKMSGYIIPRLRENMNVIHLDKEEICKGMSWIINSYDSLLAFFKTEALVADFNLPMIHEILSCENYVLLISKLSLLENQINAWKKQLFHFLLDNAGANELLGLYQKELRTIVPLLETSASNLTIGKDSEALNALENILEWLSLGLIVFEKSGVEKTVMDNIQKILTEFDGSLKNHDFVTMADIIDFDLKDALIQLMNQ